MLIDMIFLCILNNLLLKSEEEESVMIDNISNNVVLVGKLVDFNI